MYMARAEVISFGIARKGFASTVCSIFLSFANILFRVYSIPQGTKHSFN